MKKHIIRAALFLLAVLAVDRTIYFALSRIEAKRVESGSFSLLYSGLADFDIVFFGSSRTSLHINPKVVEDRTGRSAYNFGLEATNFDQHLFTAEEYLIQNRKPRLLIFEADLWSLDERPLKFLTYIFQRYSGKSLHTFRLVNGPAKPAYVYYLERLKDSILMSARYRNQVPDLIAGYMNGQVTETEDYVTIAGAHLRKKAFAREEPPPPRLLVGAISEERAARLTAFLNKCRNEGIQTVLLMSPYYRPDLQILPEDYERVSRRFQEIAAETGSRFLDFTYEADLVSNPDIFYNRNHLSREGADLFSRKVGERLADIMREGR